MIRFGYVFNKCLRHLWQPSVVFLLVATCLLGCDTFSLFDELDQVLGDVSGALILNPETAIVSVDKHVNFSASGGQPPYEFSIYTGAGTVDPDSGEFKAPDTSTDTVVVVTDGVGEIDLAVVRAIAPLKMSPQAAVLEAATGTQTFTATDGISPYTFAIISGAGTINPTGDNKAEYAAPTSAGTAIVEVEDSVGSIKQAAVTISPIGALVINPPSASVSVETTVWFAVSGGLGPYFFSLHPPSSGTLTLQGNNGALYTAPMSVGSATVRVTDSSLPSSQTVEASITVVPAEKLAISPQAVKIKERKSFGFSASGGLGPYTYAVVSGKGTIEADTGRYTAGEKGRDKVEVTDSLGSRDAATVTVKK